MFRGYELPYEIYNNVFRKADKLNNIDPSVLDDYITAICNDYCVQNNYEGDKATDFIGKVKKFVSVLMINNPVKRGVIKGINSATASGYKSLSAEQLLDKLIESNNTEDYMIYYAAYINRTSVKNLRTA